MNGLNYQYPAIYVVLQDVINFPVAPLLYGIEEEGIPFEFISLQANSLIQLAYEAAKHSSLAVGVAVNKEYIVVHYKYLSQERPLFVLHNYEQRDHDELRILGCNAARLVKGLPFK